MHLGIYTNYADMEKQTCGFVSGRLVRIRSFGAQSMVHTVHIDLARQGMMLDWPVCVLICLGMNCTLDNAGLTQTGQHAMHAGKVLYCL